MWLAGRIRWLCVRVEIPHQWWFSASKEHRLLHGAGLHCVFTWEYCCSIVVVARMYVFLLKLYDKTKLASEQCSCVLFTKFSHVLVCVRELQPCGCYRHYTACNSVCATLMRKLVCSNNCVQQHWFHYELVVRAIRKHLFKLVRRSFNIQWIKRQRWL